MSSRTGWVLTGLLWAYYLTALLVPRPEFPWLLAGLLVGSGLVSAAMAAVRHRLGVVAVVVAATTLIMAPAGIGAVLFCQASLARHGRRRTAVLTAGWVVVAKVIGLLITTPGQAWGSASSFELTVAVAGVALVTVVGWLLSSQEAGSRSASAAETARREAEEARLEGARLAERERIAREMHDVLAHRLSLVALHAAALAYRSDLDTDTARQSAGLIQRNAQQSLTDLRAVLGTLRSVEGSSESLTPEPPQPTLAELPVLLAEAEDAGQRITREITGIASLPELTGRQAYRIVQEALTNARRHAPGAPITVRIDGPTPDRATLEVRVSNPLADLAPVPSQARPGYGLIGIDERVRGVGGTVRHGRQGDSFVIEASLPVEEGRP